MAVTHATLTTPDHCRLYQGIRSLQAVSRYQIIAGCIMISDHCRLYQGIRSLQAVSRYLIITGCIKVSDHCRLYQVIRSLQAVSRYQITAGCIKVSDHYRLYQGIRSLQAVSRYLSITIITTKTTIQQMDHYSSAKCNIGYECFGINWSKQYEGKGT